MSSFLFVTWAGGGNVNPARALAERLVGRGHAVRALGTRELAPRFESVGATYVGRRAATEWDLSVTADEVLAEARRVATDVVVVDYMQPGALCGAEAAGLPVVALVHTLYAAMLVDGDLLTMYMAADTDGVAAVRERLGLAPVARVGALLDRCARVLVTCPRSLDLPLDPLPVNLRYVGALHESPKPLVVVSLGTTPMDEVAVIERVLTAASTLPVSVHATVGDHLDPRTIAAPANAVVTGYVPHTTLLPVAAAFVNHAGLGGVLAALAAGVPMVCIPLGRDQPANADAVTRIGAGVMCAPDATVDELRAAIESVLADPSYKRAPLRDEDSVAVDELEALTG